MAKKILVLGSTGAMGCYLTEKLVSAGYEVFSVSRSGEPTLGENHHAIVTADATNPEFLQEMMKTHYDVFVDFMSYGSIAFRKAMPLLLSNTDQYFYLSSCRVFANEETPITETTPRLLDVTTDEELLFSDNYCMFKARSEDALRHSFYKNWTIIRPSTTYSKKRCQLLSLERESLLPYIFSGKPVFLDERAKDIPASLTWGSDVADMILGLMFKEEALCNDYNVTSSEYLTWTQIAEIYKDLFGLNYEWVSPEEYYRFKKPDFTPEKDLNLIWQMKYGRLFNRIYDNTKLLQATGLKQENFLSLYDGLKHERETILAKDEKVHSAHAF